MAKDIILNYNGKLTQTIISENINIFENNIENIGTMGKVVTIAIELFQNMMTYSKTDKLGCQDIAPAGFIQVSKEDNIYYLESKNITSIKDKLKIEPKLLEIQSLDTNGIKKRYKELRKSGENAHNNNGGIGFFEIAKQTSSLEFEFISINEEKYHFILRATVKPRKKD